MVGHARSLKARLDGLQAMTEGNPDQVDLQAAIALVHGLHADVTALQSDVRPFFWLMPYLGWAPRYGGDIQASPHMLVMGSALMDAATFLLDAFSPLLEDAPGDPIQHWKQQPRRGLALTLGGYHLGRGDGQIDWIAIFRWPRWR